MDDLHPVGDFSCYQSFVTGCQMFINCVLSVFEMFVNFSSTVCPLVTNWFSTSCQMFVKYLSNYCTFVDKRYVPLVQNDNRGPPTDKHICFSNIVCEHAFWICTHDSIPYHVYKCEMERPFLH